MFFRTASGNLPVRDWLKFELGKEQRKAVGKDIQSVEFGWPIGMPTVRKIEAYLWEVRTRFSSGISRVIFTVQSDRMILLHGFVKKSNKLPMEDLHTARTRLRAQMGKG